MKWLIGILVVCFAAGLLFGLSHRDGNDPEAERLLKLAAAAPRNHDYTANATTFATYGDDLLHSEAVVYNAKGGLSRIEYRLGSLSGVIAGRTRDGVEWRYDPLHRSMTTEKRYEGDDPDSKFDLDLLLKNFRAKVVKEDATVANRPAEEVLLRSHAGGGSRSLWIDRETGVILRSMERNDGNELVAGTQYKSIRYGETASPDQFLPIPPGGAPVRWRPQEDFASSVTPREVQAHLKTPLILPTYLPAGYVHEGHYLYWCPGCNTRTAVTRYVNGLDSLNVVQAPDDCEQHMEKRPMNFGLGKAVFVRNGPNYFWVMGELPQEELEKVSRSLTSAAK
jgi:outer membrane lipoprotein-sorting protein